MNDNTEREKKTFQVPWPFSLLSYPLFSLLLLLSSSSSFPLRILKLTIADSALREERACLQRPLHSAWATIPRWITFTTVSSQTCLSSSSSLSPSGPDSPLKCFAKAGKMEPNQLFNGFGPLQPAVAVH